MKYEHKTECFAIPVSKDDLAKILNVSYVTVDRLMSNHEIDYLKIRGSVRFSKKQIEEYIQRAEVKNVSDKKNANDGEK